MEGEALRRAGAAISGSGIARNSSLASTGWTSRTPGTRREPGREPVGHGVGVGGVGAASGPASSIGDELRADEAHLGQEVPGALAPLGQARGEGRVEHHHRLGRQGAVLGGAQRQHVDAGAPGQPRPASSRAGPGRWPAARRPCARAARARGRGRPSAATSPGPVDRAPLGRLGQADRRRATRGGRPASAASASGSGQRARRRACRRHRAGRSAWRRRCRTRARRTPRAGCARSRGSRSAP